MATPSDVGELPPPSLYGLPHLINIPFISGQGQAKQPAAPRLGLLAAQSKTKLANGSATNRTIDKQDTVDARTDLLQRAAGRSEMGTLQPPTELNSPP